MIGVVICLMAGRTFYVSPLGNDAADGLSKGHAWKSLGRISREKFQLGDKVILESGAKFDGSLDLTSPVAIISEGKPAVISSSERVGIAVRSGGITIKNLTLVGLANTKAEKHKGILLAAPKDTKCARVRIERVDVSGFGGPGIAMMSEKGNSGGFEDVSILNSQVHGNYGTGIITEDGIAFDQKGFGHKKLLIRDCTVSRNFDGNGIIVSGVDDAVIEYCRSTGNQGKEGALGMWAWCAKNVVFRYCIADGTRGKGDGGGYDLDGGTINCVVEHCLSYDNDGPGYMHCDFPDAPRTHHNVIRSSVSIDDGRKAKGEPYGFGFVVWGSGLYDCTIEKNLAVQTKDDPLNRENGMLFATFIRMDKVPFEQQRLEKAVFKGNVVVVTGKGASFVRNNFPNNVPREVTFIGNVYRSDYKPAFLFGPNGEKRFTTLDEWKAVGNDTQAPPRKTPEIGDYKALKPRHLPSFFRKLGM